MQEELLPALFAPDIRQKARGQSNDVDGSSICYRLSMHAMQEEFLPALSGDAIDDGDYRLELAHLPVKYSGLDLPTTANSATLNHQAS